MTSPCFLHRRPLTVWSLAWRVFVVGVGLAVLPVRGASVPASLREVVIVFKTHFDLGYTDFASNVVQRYRTTMIDDALRVVDANRDVPPERRFAWTLAGWPAHRILEPVPGPAEASARRERIRDAFRTGRFVVHALPFTTHTESLEPEDLVHGLGFATRLAAELGLPRPTDAKMTDVPSHAWLLPTLLRHAGVEFLHLGCNAASRSPRVPQLFAWEGPDGSRVLTMYTAESYGTGLVPPPDWPYPAWLALIHTGDNHGPPRPEEVASLLNEARDKLPGVRVRVGRMSDFATAIRSSGAPVPVVRGDMPDTWIHGILSDPQGARQARRGRPRLAAAELLGTLLPAWGVPVSDEQAELDRARERSLLYGEHTWGGAYWWIYGSYRAHYGDAWRAERAQGRFARIEASWAEHSAYIEEMERLVEPILEDRLRRLARAVAVPGPRIIVFNPLPWPRRGWVEVRTRPGAVAAVRASDQAGPIPVAVSEGGQVGFTADVPALGYRTYVPVATTPPPAAPRASVDVASGRLESPFFRVEFDAARLALRSVIDKRTGREWVSRGARHGFGQFVHERFSANDVGAFVKAYVKITADWATNELGKPMLPPADAHPYQSRSPNGGRVRFAVDERGAHLIAEVATNGPSSVARELRVTLPADQACLDLEWTIDKPADPWPEAGWIAFPFDTQAPRFRLGRPGSVVDPARDIVAGSNRHLFALQTGVTLTGPDGVGLGICPLDSPLVSLGRPGGWAYTLDDPPREGAVYINVFNNQWTTNFRLWNEGRWRTGVRVWGTSAGSSPATNLVLPSLEARSPLLGAAVDGPPGERPPTGRGVHLMREGVALAALAPGPGGRGTLLRVWELAGQGGAIGIQLPERRLGSEAVPVDLRGEPVGTPIPIRDDRLVAELPAYTPATWWIRD